MRVCGIYRPPNINFIDFIDESAHFYDYFGSNKIFCKSVVLISGDFNIY